LRLHGTHGLLLVIPNWASEALVKLKRDDWLRELVEVTTKDIGRIMNSVAGPIESLSVSVWRVKGGLELLDTLLGPGQSENTLHIDS